MAITFQDKITKIIGNLTMATDVENIYTLLDDKHHQTAGRHQKYFNWASENNHST